MKIINRIEALLVILVSFALFWMPIVGTFMDRVRGHQGWSTAECMRYNFRPWWRVVKDYWYTLTTGDYRYRF